MRSSYMAILLVRLYFSHWRWHSELISVSLRALYGISSCSWRCRLWFVIFPLRLRCLKKKAMPASSKSKKLPSARWLSMNSFLSVPTNRAILNLNWGYSSILSEKSIAAPFVGIPFFNNFHFDNVSSIGALMALAGILPPSTPSRMHPLICFSFKSDNDTSSAVWPSQAYCRGLCALIRSSYMVCGMTFVVLSTL